MRSPRTKVFDVFNFIMITLPRVKSWQDRNDFPVSLLQLLDVNCSFKCTRLTVSYDSDLQWSRSIRLIIQKLLVIAFEAPFTASGSDFWVRVCHCIFHGPLGVVANYVSVRGSGMHFSTSGPEKT